MFHRVFAACLTVTALFVSAQAEAQNAVREPSFPQFTAPPTIDPKGKALFAEHCSVCHDA